MLFKHPCIALLHDSYDVNLVWSTSIELGSTSPVTARENQMLDGADGATSRTPGAGQPGTSEDPGCTDDN